MSRMNWKFPISLALGVVAAAGIAHAQPAFSVLYQFGTGHFAGGPSGLVEVQPGKFLGTADQGASIFKLDASGDFKGVYQFPGLGTGVWVSSLTPALNGQVYGGAGNSGDTPVFSELFSVRPDGRVETYPYNAATQGTPGFVVQSPDNHLYAMFGSGGVAGGTIARLSDRGKVTPIYTFAAAQGTPWLSLAGNDGALYGLSYVTDTHGVAGAGVFKLTPRGVLTWIHQKLPIGSSPYAYLGTLILSVDGTFYGTLPGGGQANAGSIYKLTPDGQLTILYEFANIHTGVPSMLLQASDGRLYGTTTGQYRNYNSQSIFRLNPTTGQFETLYRFKDNTSGQCPCSLLQASDGKLYGLASMGGIDSQGTAFVLDAGLPPPPPRVSRVTPLAGPPGQKVRLWGGSLLGTTAVSFNGAPASFQQGSKQGLSVTVPANAASGPITITTMNGSFTTKKSFTVQ